MMRRFARVFAVLASLWGLLRVLGARPKVVVYANDTLGQYPWDPRMDGVFRWLEREGISYVHLVHAMPRWDIVPYWWRRTSPVLYLESLALFGDRLAVRILALTGSRHLWCLDDYRYWPRIVRWSRDAHLFAVLFQHGRFTQHQASLRILPGADIVPPNGYVVWNHYWMDKLIKLSPFFAAHADVIRVGGRAGVWAIPRSQPRLPGSNLRVLVVHEPSAPAQEVRDFLEHLCGVRGVDVYYKIRGDQSASGQIAHLGVLQERVHVTSDVPSCDVALGSYSTLLYELIEQGIPVGVVSLSSLQADELIRDGLASLIERGSQSLGEDLQALAATSRGELERRSQILRTPDILSGTLDQLIETSNVRH